jgi:hypothetical protein
MRHVTDGELHAYLDGALDLLPEGRGEEVRDHLSFCEACQDRLQEEERVRAEAGALLGAPGMGEFTLPSFEELRERAEAQGAGEGGSTDLGQRAVNAPRRRLLRGLPLAWAATIVLALGVGWMGGQVWQSIPSGTDAGTVPPIPGSSADRASEADASRGEAQAPVTALVTSDAGPAGGAQEAAGRGQAFEAPEEDETPPPTMASADAGATGAEEERAATEVPPSEAETKVVLAEAEAERTMAAADSPRLGSEPLALEALVVTGRADAARLSMVPLADSSRTAEQRQSESMQARARFAAPLTDAPEAPDSVPVAGEPTFPVDLEASLAIPGLEVASIEWEERVPGEKALLIRQVLPPSDTLELRYLGMLLGADADPEARAETGINREGSTVGRVYANILEASLPPGWHQVVREWGRGLLVARGPLSEANLRGLLKTLHE